MIRVKMAIFLSSLVVTFGDGIFRCTYPIFRPPAAQANELIAQQSPQTLPEAKKADLEAQARAYELVLQREPENDTALQGLLGVRLELGDITGAIRPLEKLAQLHPEKPIYAVMLAQAKRQTGDRSAAAQTYRSILSSNPGNIEALQGLASLLLEQEQPEAAIALLEDTLKMAPQANQSHPGRIDIVSVQVILGQIYAEQNRYEEAIAVLDRAIAVDERDFRPILAKALVLKRQGLTQESQRLLQRSLDLAPEEYKQPIQKLVN